MSTDPEQEIRRRLNAETARISGRELAPHLARGALVRVDPALDLIDVAAAFAKDRRETVAGWLAKGQVAVMDDDPDGRDWLATDAVFWAVVVAPWVLVQPVGRD